MKCPHCLEENAAPVFETRRQGGAVYRKRLCAGKCRTYFVTVEKGDADAVMPFRKSRYKPVHKLSSLQGDAADLAKVWK